MHTKNVFGVHGVDANDNVVFNKPLRRSQLLPLFAKLAPYLIGMEACASTHYWARELNKLGDNVRLLPGQGRDGVRQPRQGPCDRRCGRL
jgi:transposase